MPKPMSDEEAAELGRKMTEQNNRWNAIHAHRRAVRNARRGWPPIERRPICPYCDRPLRPDWKTNDTRYDESNESGETDILRGWEGYGNVFCTATCAIKWALSQPFILRVRANNEALAEKLRNEREESKKG